MNKNPHISQVQIKRARSFFFSQGTVPEGLVPEFIVRSWQRSVSNGVPVEGETAKIPRLSSQELECIKEENQELLSYALPVMENLYERIMHTSSKVVLADPSGVVLHSFGDHDFFGKGRTISLLPGGIWSEGFRGTNAIGTALIELGPVEVHSAEHFIASNHILTCSAAPIFNPFGRILGVLDVSGVGRVRQPHTMALVQLLIQQIENQMFSRVFENDLVLHFHVRPELVGTMSEGIVVYSQEGRFLAANQNALKHLEMERCQIEQHSFSFLFNAPLSAIFDQPGQFPQPVRKIHTRTGISIYCHATPRILASAKGPLNAGIQSDSSPAKAQGPETNPLLEELELGDPEMRRIIAKVRKILGHDIPVLLEGESGTGKELFARAMHNSSMRRNGPFVALNCAALPESLIESELFGYLEGAFTGAKRKGYSGKIRQADQGTLFLDEIGDMPLQFQAKLLRVLQDRTVSPLGGTNSYQVDFALVCATNRSLREEVEAGRFREDLFYRLNGILITLPCLRQRDDRLELARSMISSMAGFGRSVSLSPELVEIFRNHPWPGNIRQMHSVLRTALALLGHDSQITREHLPDDFIEQCSRVELHPNTTGSLATSPRLMADGASLENLEKLAIREALRECRGNVAAAARRLGISRNTLYRKMQALG